MAGAFASVIIWLNGTVGAGKTAVGQSLARLLPKARFVDGDESAGPPCGPDALRWRAASDRLLQLVARRGYGATLVIGYPIERGGFVRLRAACSRAQRSLVVVTLAPPLSVTLRQRGDRALSPAEQARVRQMRSEGYHRRRFVTFTLPNTAATPGQTARQIRLRTRW